MKFDAYRRRVVQGVFGVFIPTAAAAKLLSTPSQTEGPFYPTRDQSDKDLDLTQVKGKDARAQGKVIHVQGNVISQQGTALAEAKVEIWQANTWGRYSHVRDPNRAPLDPNFQGWGIVQSDQNGFFRFKTIYPGFYPAGPGWQRPPHIHFKVYKPGYRRLTTQMYFPGEDLNQRDLILQNLDKKQQLMLISKRLSVAGKTDTYEFNIVLAV